MKPLVKIACSLLVAELALPVAMADPADTAMTVLRPALSMFTLNYGSASLRDSYLSPLTYGGSWLALGYEHFQATGFNPLHYVRQLQVELDYAHVTNWVGNHAMQSLMVGGQWSLMRRWQAVPFSHSQLMVGPMALMRGGAIYKPTNSNNIVALRMQAAVGGQAMAVYNTSLFHNPLSLRYECTLPVLGAFFSPDYDEAYYEIYVGNHNGLAHVGWWGNRFDFRHSLTADWQLGATIVRLGYRGGFETSWVSHIATRHSTHSLVVGVGGNFLSLSPKKKLSTGARLVSAQYE